MGWLVVAGIPARAGGRQVKQVVYRLSWPGKSQHQHIDKLDNKR